MSENTIIVEIQYKSSCKFPIPIQNAVVEKCYLFYFIFFLILWLVAVRTICESPSAVSFNLVTHINRHVPFLHSDQNCMFQEDNRPHNTHTGQVHFFPREQRRSFFWWFHTVAPSEKVWCFLGTGGLRFGDGAVVGCKYFKKKNILRKLNTWVLFVNVFLLFVFFCPFFKTIKQTYTKNTKNYIFCQVAFRRLP